MHAIGYIRVSTDQQADSGLGLEAQTLALQDYAKKFNLKLESIFEDSGLSGSLSIEKRPGLLQALASLPKKGILIVAKRDRLGRDPLLMAMIESAIHRKKARIVSVSGEGTDKDDAGSVFMRRMIDAFGEYERLIISERTKSALRVKKLKNERIGRIPYGFRLSPDGIHLEQDEQEQKNMEYMLSLRDRRCTLWRIAQIMNRNGMYNRNNQPWTTSSVFRITNRHFEL